MTPKTERKILLTMLAIRALRKHGVIPQEAPVRPSLMEFVSKIIGEPVSKATFSRVIKSALASARRAAANPSDNLLEELRHDIQ